MRADYYWTQPMAAQPETEPSHTEDGEEDHQDKPEPRRRGRRRSE